MMMITIIIIIVCVITGVIVIISPLCTHYHYRLRKIKATNLAYSCLLQACLWQYRRNREWFPGHTLQRALGSKCCGKERREFRIAVCENTQWTVTPMPGLLQ